MDRFSRETMRIAAIDIGTNTALLLIADVDESTGKLTPLHHEQRFPRIGKDVDEKKTIQQPAFERTRSTLLEYKAIISSRTVNTVIACATSAVRDARNRKEFVEFIKKETGITVEIISGEEEANLTYKGAISGFPHSNSRYAVIDIGGGSTEISFYDSLNNFNKQSLQIGSVRLTERYFKHHPPTKEEIENATNNIVTLLENAHDVNSLLVDRKKGTNDKEHAKRALSDTVVLVGVAGTVTTLACLEQGVMEFDVEKVSGFTLTRAMVQYWFDRLAMLPVERIRQLSNTTEGRADILTAGALILLEVMKRFDFGEIIVSERGLRYGMVLEKIGFAGF